MEHVGSRIWDKVVRRMLHALRISVAAAAVTAASVAAFVAVMSAPEAAISRSFATALGSKGSGEAAGFDPAHLHLSSMPVPLEPAAAGLIEAAIVDVFRTGAVVDASTRSGMTTQEVTDAVLRSIHRETR